MTPEERQSIAEEQKKEQLYTALDMFWNGKIPGLNNQKTNRNWFNFPIWNATKQNRLINSIDKVDFQEAWKNKNIIRIEILNIEHPIYYIGLQELVSNKETAALYKDLEDLKYLKRLDDSKRE